MVWQFAKYEVVRFAPYEECERLSARQRWSTFPYEKERPEWMKLVPSAKANKCALSQSGEADDGGMASAAGAAAAQEREEKAMYDEL